MVWPLFLSWNRSHTALMSLVTASPGPLGLVAQLCSGSPDQAREEEPAGCPEKEGQSWFAQTGGVVTGMKDAGSKGGSPG